MNNKFRTLMFVLYLSGVSTLFLLSGDKYSFMYDMDHSIPIGSIQDNSGNGTFLSFIILCLLLIIQVVFFYCERNKKLKIASLLLALIAVFFFLLS